MTLQVLLVNALNFWRYRQKSDKPFSANSLSLNQPLHTRGSGVRSGSPVPHRNPYNKKKLLDSPSGARRQEVDILKEI